MNPDLFFQAPDFADHLLFDHIRSLPIISSETTTLGLFSRPQVVVFGKICQQNRNVGFFSDTSKGYRYSGKLMSSQPMTEWMVDILNKVNRHLETNFNGILINHYLNGSDYIGAHSDDEKGLAPGRNVVAAISFGAVRKFRIRNRSDKKIVADIPTEHGSLMVMQGDFQNRYTHEIPPQKTINEPRWSLTFRHHTE